MDKNFHWYSSISDGTPKDVFNKCMSKNMRCQQSDILPINASWWQRQCNNESVQYMPTYQNNTLWTWMITHQIYDLTVKQHQYVSPNIYTLHVCYVVLSFKEKPRLKSTFILFLLYALVNLQLLCEHSKRLLVPQCL